MDEEKQRIFGLRSQVEQYFDTQAQRLLEQARAASFLTTHSTVVGDAGEQGLRSFLRNHLPHRYGVGTGHIVSFRGSSAQVDTIIFDSLDCFKIPITEDATLYSIEGVYGAIEIKSSPSRRNMNRDIKVAVTNIHSVKRLIHHPFYFSTIPTFTRLSDLRMSKSETRSYRPICAIFILGSGGTFANAVKTLKREACDNKDNEQFAMPELFCVLDEKNYGLYGYDNEQINDKDIRRRYWQETCASPGQTLALFLYWFLHKMILDRITEQPIFHNTEQTTIWPAVMAPIIPRMHVDVSEEGEQISWGWKNETRKFEEQ